jgi:hypothetical protein
MIKLSNLLPLLSHTNFSQIELHMNGAQGTCLLNFQPYVDKANSVVRSAMDFETFNTTGHCTDIMDPDRLVWMVCGVLLKGSLET